MDTQVLRVGIISDTQLAPKGGSDVYDSYLKGALELLKQKEIHMLIHAGDYTDVAWRMLTKIFKDIYEGVYPGNSSPMKLFIMGNHDIGSAISSSAGRSRSRARCAAGWRSIPVNRHGPTKC